MTFDEYQKLAATTAIYKKERAFEYLLPALAGEVGELCSLFAKSERDDVILHGHNATKEIGDILWMVAQIATELSVPLGEIAHANAEKLRSRKERGVLGGSGDNR